MILADIKYITPKKVLELKELYYVKPQEVLNKEFKESGHCTNILKYEGDSLQGIVNIGWEFLKENRYRIFTTYPEAEKLFVEEKFGYVYPLETFQRDYERFSKDQFLNTETGAPMSLKEENEQLKQEIHRLRKCLQFYSNRRNFDFNSEKEIKFCNSDDQADVFQPFGTKAKEALKNN